MKIKINDADIIAQRIHDGIQKDGDWLRLMSLIEMGVKPTCYEVEASKLQIKAKRPGNEN